MNLHEDEDEGEESEGEKPVFEKALGESELRESNLNRFENSTNMLQLKNQRSSADPEYSQKYEDCFTSSCLESQKLQKSKGVNDEDTVNAPETRNLVPGSLR